MRTTGYDRWRLHLRSAGLGRRERIRRRARPATSHLATAAQPYAAFSRCRQDQSAAIRPARTVYEITDQGRLELVTQRDAALEVLLGPADPVSVVLIFASGADDSDLSSGWPPGVTRLQPNSMQWRESASDSLHRASCRR